ncbi:MAG: hypothetical protein RIR06_2002 [Bacteroidota bacterium]|jgi:hypothetical protein
MNERIKELAAGAGIYGAVDINGNYENEAEVKKFAELIVRECARVMDNADSEGRLDGDYAMYYLGEHFGVEE